MNASMSEKSGLPGPGSRKSQELMEYMKSEIPAEVFQFGIEQGKIELFLSARGYEIISHLTAEGMERKYLSLRDGSTAGKVLAFYCLVHTSVLG